MVKLFYVLPALISGECIVDYWNPVCFSCALNNGYPLITASFWPISESAANGRQYEFYPKHFGADEYWHGMFSDASGECMSLLNRKIMSDRITFNFTLDDNVAEKCGINTTNYFTENDIL